jgi:hypothetical protein
MLCVSEAAPETIALYHKGRFAEAEAPPEIVERWRQRIGPAGRFRG